MTLEDLPAWLNSLTAGEDASPADAGFTPPLAGLARPTSPPRAKTPQDPVRCGAERLAERIIKQFGKTSDVRHPRRPALRESDVAPATRGEPQTQNVARILEHS
jgi:hypothetical protein